MNSYNLDQSYQIARMEHEQRIQQAVARHEWGLGAAERQNNQQAGWLATLRKRRSLVRLIFFAAATLAVLISSGMALPTPTVHAALTQVADGETIYIVQPGDTLGAIAHRYGVTVQALADYNGLTGTTIYVGQRLLIPVHGVPNAGPVYPISHVVQRGETLTSIALRYGTTVASLMQRNGLISDRIYAGQRLTISVATDPTLPQISHVVVRGDTLSGLARRYNVSVAAIKANNGLTSNTIYVGQRLHIPTSLGYPNEPGSGSPVILPPTVVRFQPGATGATVSGVSLYNASPSYSLRAFARQMMRVSLEIENAGSYITVLAPNGANMAASDGPIRHFEGRLPVTGAYIIQVINPMNGVANFSLHVEIE